MDFKDVAAGLGELLKERSLDQYVNDLVRAKALKTPRVIVSIARMGLQCQSSSGLNIFF